VHQNDEEEEEETTSSANPKNLQIRPKTHTARDMLRRN
jgi:hypothetical protein